MKRTLYSLLTLLSFFLSVEASAAATKERPPFRGGPLDGISVGEVIRPDNGVRIIGLKPSIPNASPIPEKDRPAVEAFIKAFEQKKPADVQGFLAKGAKLETCGHGFYSSCGLSRKIEDLRVAEDCTFNTPYYLGNHVVRLEWLYKGALWYWSEMYLRDGKLRLVRMHPADVPPDRPF